MALHLCIGGPRDRKRLASMRDGHSILRIGIPRALEGAEIGQAVDAGDPVQFERFTYHLHNMRFDDGSTISIWAPEGKSLREALEAVLLAYEEGRD